MNEETCPCCPNHCSVNDLSCGRGKSYFEGNQEESGKEHRHHSFENTSLDTIEDKILNEMRKCGHKLHHNSGNINLDFLTDEEKDTLMSLLSKCNENI